MPVYKDTERGSWYCQFYYEDWTGKRKKKYKRGFRTKKEAQDYESEFKRVANADMDMSVASFVEVYFNDKSGELKERSQRNKRYEPSPPAWTSKTKGFYPVLSFSRFFSHFYPLRLTEYTFLYLLRLCGYLFKNSYAAFKSA